MSDFNGKYTYTHRLISEDIDSRGSTKTLHGCCQNPLVLKGVLAILINESSIQEKKEQWPEIGLADYSPCSRVH